jgi:NAD(P)-dependent dehydrogenase (short-subunit alcohol dehydrogenase family)
MSLNPDRIKNKNCVVTGAAGSMGFDVATRYAEYGARVFLIDYAATVQDKTKELTDKGYMAYGIQLDITDHDAVIAAFDKIVAEHGAIFALCNCAGIGATSNFEETSPELWNRVLNVNVLGTVYCCKGAIRSMREAREGKIINLASKAGKTGSKLMTVYGASKGAMITLTQALAQEYAQYHVHVNAVCPDIIGGTGVWETQVCPNYMRDMGLSREEVTRIYEAKVPLGHFARMEDVTDAICYLTISADDSTGQSLNVTGGRFMH